MNEETTSDNGEPISPPLKAGPEQTLRPPRAFHSPRAWGRLLLVLILGLSLDGWSKWWCFENVAETPVVLDRARLLAEPSFSPIPWRHEGRPLLPADLLELRLVLNPGAVFGIGPDRRVFFIVFTIIALGGGLLVFGRFTTVRHRLAHAAIGMILAGGLGNLYDRLAIGRVRDFLHMLPGWHLPFGWSWPGNNPEIFPWVFNVADVMLLVGMLLLMVHINRTEGNVKS